MGYLNPVPRTFRRGFSGALLQVEGIKRKLWNDGALWVNIFNVLPEALVEAEHDAELQGAFALESDRHHTS
jgi:hypothetical protein